MPRDKNDEKYQAFMEKAQDESFENQETFEKLKEEIFYVDTKEVIYGVTIAKSYLGAVNRATEIKIEPPYVTSLLVDYNYMGYCASISFESLKSYLINKGELKSNQIDSSFIVILFLKVRQNYKKQNCTRSPFQFIEANHS